MGLLGHDHENSSWQARIGLYSSGIEQSRCHGPCDAVNKAGAVGALAGRSWAFRAHPYCENLSTAWCNLAVIAADFQHKTPIYRHFLSRRGVSTVFASLLDSDSSSNAAGCPGGAQLKRNEL